MRVQPSLKPKEEETSEVCSSVSHMFELLCSMHLMRTFATITYSFIIYFYLRSDYLRCCCHNVLLWVVSCFRFDWQSGILTASSMLSNHISTFYLYVAIIMLIVCIKYKKFTSVVPCSINVFIHCANIYIETVHLIHIHTHTHYFYSLHNSVHIGLILITLMYLNCASNTRNIQVSDQDSVLADTQYSITRIGSGAQKTWSGHPYFILNIVKWVPNSSRVDCNI